MSNSLQDQFLKAGMVSKKQVQKANKTKHNKKKQNKGKNKEVVIDESKLAAQQVAKEKADSDRALNKKKEEQAKKKAIAAEINQLVKTNRIKCEDDCDVSYNFTHADKVNCIYINENIKQQIIKGRLGIVRIDEGYELVAAPVAKKIQQRDEACVILFSSDEQEFDENDEYADYQIPDDLTW